MYSPYNEISSIECSEQSESHRERCAFICRQHPKIAYQKYLNYRFELLADFRDWQQSAKSSHRTSINH